MDEIGLLARIRQRRHQDLRDLPAVQHSRNALHVVGVEMRQDEERHLLDCQRVEAPPHGSRVRARVDDHSGAVTSPQHQRVALADVARDDRANRVVANPASAPGRP